MSHISRLKWIILLLCLLPSLLLAKPTNPPTKVLRVVTTAAAPFSMNERGILTGFSIQFWQQVAKTLDLKYTIEMVPSTEDIIKAVEQGKADIGIAAVSLTYKRALRVNFSHAYFKSGLQILVTKKHYSFFSNLLNILIHEKIYKLALVLLMIIFIFAHIIWLVERKDNPNFPKRYLQGLGAGIWWAIVTMTTVGYGDKTPKTGLGKAMGLLAILISVTFLTLLFATLTTHLTLDAMRTNIHGPNDLHGKEIGTIRGTVAVEYLYSHGIKPKEYSDLNATFAALKKGEIDAVVEDSPILNYHVSHSWKSDAVVVGPIFDQDGYGIVLPLNTPYLHKINKAVLKVMHSNSYRYLYMKWIGAQLY